MTDGETALASDFADVAADGDKMFFALDRKYGRVFTYDTFGNLLFVFRCV